LGAAFFLTDETAFILQKTRMRIVLQRVSEASVSIDGRIAGQIGRGLLLLLGIHQQDTPECADFLAQKAADLRIFSDQNGKMNLSGKETGASALVISQFTLYGDCHKGRRPNFMNAAPPGVAIPLYERFIAALRTHLPIVQTGEFGAMMQVQLVNDGPVTLILEKESAAASLTVS
jgi:D-aminoacyl-tRNA deacylase